MSTLNDRDVRRCMAIVRNELIKKNISVTNNILKNITKDIMNISYSKGGDYSDTIIQRYAETYIEKGFYKEFLTL